MNITNVDPGPPPRPDTKPTRRTRTTFGALVGVTLGTLLCMLLVSCSGTGFLNRGGQAAAGGGSLAGAQATQTASAHATEGALPLIPLPYTAAAPSCNEHVGSWRAMAAQGVMCLAGPDRVRVTALPYTTGSCCVNEVEWPFGLPGRFPNTFRVSVDVSGLAGQTLPSGTDLIARLNVHLQPAVGLRGASPILSAGFDISDGSSASYTGSLAGPHADGNFAMADLARPATVVITVDASTASCAINGTTYLTSRVLTPVTVIGISLEIIGPQGATVEFSNLKVEQVIGGTPISY